MGFLVASQKVGGLDCRQGAALGQTQIGRRNMSAQRQEGVEGHAVFEGLSRDALPVAAGETHEMVAAC